MPEQHAPAELVAVYAHIARTRMQGLPLLNPALEVEAVGFERGLGPQPDETGWLGMLVTPWFMNLVWWPDEDLHVPAVGDTRVHRFGTEDYRFIGAHEGDLGRYEMCSLFSPMGDFTDARGARDVAEHALRTLRESRAATALAAPARRAFLTGRPQSANGVRQA